MNYLRITDFQNKDAKEFSGAVRLEKTQMSKELIEDYILPDYLPDAKKVMSITCYPTLSTRFLSGGSLEYSGNIAIRVVYLSEDKGMCQASFSLPFEDRLSNEGINDECVDIIIPRVYQKNIRLQNPRKLNIRIKCGADIEIWKRGSFLPWLYGGKTRELVSSVETNPEYKKCLSVISVREDEMTFSEDISLDKSLPDIKDVVSCHTELGFDECKASENEMMLRGGVTFSMLYKDADGKYHCLKRTLPLNETITGEGVSGGSLCVARTIAASPEITVREDEFGRTRVVELILNYSLDVTAYNPSEVLITTDAYSTVAETANTPLTTELLSCNDRIMGGFSVNESLNLSDTGIKSEDNIIFYTAESELKLSEEPMKNTKLGFVGAADISVLLERPDGSFYSQSIKIPVKYSSNKSYEEGVSYECDPISKITNLRLRSDSEKLYADFELGVCCPVLEKTTMTLLESIRILPDLSKSSDKSSEVIIYYPTSSDTVWSVAKKYKLTRAELSALSGAQGNELPKVVKISK